MLVVCRPLSLVLASGLLHLATGICWCNSQFFRDKKPSGLTRIKFPLSTNYRQISPRMKIVRSFGECAYSKRLIRFIIAKRKLKKLPEVGQTSWELYTGFLKGCRFCKKQQWMTLSRFVLRLNIFMTICVRFFWAQKSFGFENTLQNCQTLYRLRRGG